MKTILLFDMDGVLLEPRGYHRALQETVRTIGESLGFKDPHLIQEEIYAFEAAGITSEWDSAAICLGLMMKQIWQTDPEMSLPDALPQTQDVSRPRHPPDWRVFLNRLGGPKDSQLTPRQRAAQLLKKGLSRDKQEKIEALIAGAHVVHRSITHRTFQELVLGSETFQEVYRLRPRFNCRSYLEQFDQPAMPQHTTQSLTNWLKGEGRSAAIFTNRPSQPLEDVFGTPEAEIGANMVGLEDLAVVGYGEMDWIAKKWQRRVDRFRKPSAAHALSACLVSLEIPEPTALETSASLICEQQENPLWGKLHGSKVYVFEDTPAGIQSALRAKEHLNKMGVAIDVIPIGIGKDPRKRRALAHLNAVTYPDLARALEEEFDLN